MQTLHLARYGLISLVTLVLCLAAPKAQAAFLLQAGYTADAQGFSLSYSIPLIGRQSISLTRPGDSDLITVRIGTLVIARADIELAAIDTDNSSLDLRVAVTSPFAENESSVSDVVVPFGFADMGAFIHPLGRRLLPLNDHDIDISLLLTRNRSAYHAYLHAPPLINDLTLEGAAEDNRIAFAIPDVAEITLTLEPGPSSTQVWFVIAPIMPELPELPEGTEHHFEFDIEPVSGGPLVLPNGSYRLWCDFDIDIEKLLPAWTE
jgi:hypothetical protein